MSSSRPAVTQRARAGRLVALAPLLAVAALVASGNVTARDPFPGVGRTATPAEIKAWDIDVRPDFKGLPRGRGTVARGQDVWEAKCASCHGIFGESNQVFPPIVGGTTKEDMRRGRVAGLTSGTESQRTTMMKLSSLASLWDYVNRAMPWNNPRTLSVEEVYAVTAYMLHLGDIVPGDFTLSDENIRDVQAKLPNRNGKSNKHGLWLPHGKPDVKSVACMRNCDAPLAVTSRIPDHARDAHGNLADQTRPWGAMRGQVTMVRAASAAPPGEHAAVRALAEKSACLACHAPNQRLVGPSFAEITAKYKSDTSAETYLAGKIRNGGQGVWGSAPMPASAVSDADARQLAQWILKGLPQ
ncbi:MAG: c-type cytochrome [Burkholderiales bacterium]